MILELLDMTEEEQQGQIINWAYMNMDSAKYHAFVSKMPESLADLAFRLRDEAVEKDAYAWTDACVKVFKKACPDSYERNFDVWWQDVAQPIHWIAASLLAKEQE